MRTLFFNLCFIILLSSGCYYNNSDIVKEGTKLSQLHGSDLAKVEVLLDSVFLDSCNVFRINMSNTTDLFMVSQEISSLYNPKMIKSISNTQEQTIRNLKPRTKLIDILYLKDVFTAFSMDRLHVSTKNAYLAHISSIEKFKKVYPFLEVRSEEHTSELQSRPHLVCRLL